MAQGIAGVCEPALSGFPARKVVQAANRALPREVLVEILLNAGAVEIGAELHIVLVELPGKTVENLIVAVNTMPGIAGGGAQLGKYAPHGR